MSKPEIKSIKRLKCKYCGDEFYCFFKECFDYVPQKYGCICPKCWHGNGCTYRNYPSSFVSLSEGSDFYNLDKERAKLLLVIEEL